MSSLRAPGAAAPGSPGRRLHELEIDGGVLPALAGDFEGDLLAFAECRQAGLLDAADVDVDILRAGAS